MCPNIGTSPNGRLAFGFTFDHHSIIIFFVWASPPHILYFVLVTLTPTQKIFALLQLQGDGIYITNIKCQWRTPTRCTTLQPTTRNQSVDTTRYTACTMPISFGRLYAQDKYKVGFLLTCSVALLNFLHHFDSAHSWPTDRSGTVVEPKQEATRLFVCFICPAKIPR